MLKYLQFGLTLICVITLSHSKIAKKDWWKDGGRGRKQIPCRIEDGYNKCNKIFEMLSYYPHACMLRSKTQMYCNDLPNFNCTDDEVKIPHVWGNECALRRTLKDEPAPEGSRLIMCHDDEFRCKSSKRCIPRSWVMDEQVDCSSPGVNDTSDEDSPLAYCDEKTEFECYDPTDDSVADKWRCVPRSWVMDGVYDCKNGTDEETTLGGCYNDTTEFMCPGSERCILRRHVNDGFPDCSDGADEEVGNFTCDGRREFTCNDTNNTTRCIPRQWVRNGVDDCPGGEDETAILSECFEPDEFACLDRTRCLPRKYLCDGIQNCRDGSDEVELCRSPVMRPGCSPNEQLKPWSAVLRDSMYESECGEEEIGFKCYINYHKKHDQAVQRTIRRMVVPQVYIETNTSICHNNEDICFDGDGRFTCARCLDGTVISKAQMCDGVVDCRDLSDECTCQHSAVHELCEQTYPPLMSHEDSNIDLDMICNSTVEMAGGLDEKFCFSSTIAMDSVHEDNFTCSGGRQNSSTVVRFCDGNVDCPLKDDECSTKCYVQALEDNWEHRFVRNCFPFLKLWEFITEVKGIAGDTYERLMFVNQARALAKLCRSQVHHVQNTQVGGLFWHHHPAECEGPTRGVAESYDFLCANKDVDCPWLHICTADRSQKVDIAKVCDLKSDCEDESDELNCSNETHFYCKSGKPMVIARIQVGDGRSDCADRSDECREDAFSSASEMIKNKGLRSFVWITGIATIIFNFMILLKHFIDLKKISSSVEIFNIYILMNLALSDVIFGFTLLVIGIKSLQFSGSYCEFDLAWRSSMGCSAIGFFTVVSSQTSINLLVLLTGLRLFITIRPLVAHQLRLKVLALLCGLSWGIGILFALIPVLSAGTTFLQAYYIQPNIFLDDHVVKVTDMEKYFRKTARIMNANNSTTNFTDVHSLNNFPTRQVDVKSSFGYFSTSSVCFPDLYARTASPASAYSFALILYNLTSLLFICVAYYVVVKRATASTQTVQSQRPSERSEQMRKTMRRRVLAIILTDVACWLPIISMSIMTFCGLHLPAIVHPISAIVFLPINSLLNPILYSRLDQTASQKVADVWQSIASTFHSEKVERSELMEMQETRATNISNASTEVVI